MIKAIDFEGIVARIAFNYPMRISQNVVEESLKIIQNSAFLILYLFISGCGLIIDLACLASGRPGTEKPDYEKTDLDRSMDKMKKEHDQNFNEMREKQRQFVEEEHRRSNESFENAKHRVEEMKAKNP